jgi:hypothetical protein
MGYGEYGGGGSIAWTVDVDDESNSGKKRATASGYDPKNTDTFTVTLRYPNAGAADTDLGRLKGEIKVVGSEITFTVPVQAKNTKQIKIEW